MTDTSKVQPLEDVPKLLEDALEAVAEHGKGLADASRRVLECSMLSRTAPVSASLSLQVASARLTQLGKRLIRIAHELEDVDPSLARRLRESCSDLWSIDNWIRQKVREGR